MDTETVKLLASVATPIVVAILGILLLRKIESVKATVAKQSGFQTKWAEVFFDCCQEFMKAVEKDLSLWQCLAGLKNADDKFGTSLQSEISLLNVVLPELELRIRRCVVFSPLSGKEVATAASECLQLIGKLTTQRKGNLDEIILKMNEFNTASRKAHAEMLELNVAQPYAQAGLRKSGAAP